MASTGQRETHVPQPVNQKLSYKPARSRVIPDLMISGMTNVAVQVIPDQYVLWLFSEYFKVQLFEIDLVTRAYLITDSTVVAFFFVQFRDINPFLLIDHHLYRFIRTQSETRTTACAEVIFYDLGDCVIIHSIIQ